jgi:hypothetical protein
MRNLYLIVLLGSIFIVSLALFPGCGGEDNPVDPTNNPPVISSLTASKDTVNFSDTCTITCVAADQDGDSLIYNWSSAAGSISGAGNSVIWTSPNVGGAYTVLCEVSDGQGAAVTDSVSIMVASQVPVQGLIAYYPFTGNGNDESGNGNNGTVFGATLTSDRFGNPNNAYSFDGNDRIDVPDDPDLTISGDQFTILSWAQFSAFGVDGGYYLMGHSEGPGNTDKWIFWLANDNIKLIIGPTLGWISLGSAPFQLGNWYHVAIRKNGNELAAFVDGSPIGTNSGTFIVPDPDATFQIGTAEPDRPNRPFRGIIDDVRIYNRALDEAEIQILYHENGWGN